MHIVVFFVEGNAMKLSVKFIEFGLVLPEENLSLLKEIVDIQRTESNHNSSAK